MKSMKNQRGITLVGIAFILLLIGFVTFTVLKLFPAYMQNFGVRSSLQGMEAEKTARYLGGVDVRNAIQRRFDVNDIDQVQSKDIHIKRDGRIYNIDVDYEVKIPYISNISLLLTFKNHAVVEAQ